MNDGKGLIFNIQKYAIHDGPGIRTSVFMKGCPLYCKWCSNPESQRAHPEIMTYDIRCISCHRCEEICPVNAISFNEKRRQIDWEKCDNCFKCSGECPSKAIERIGNYLTVDEVLNEVLADEIFYRNSGGGMTVSGGEPLLQWEFVAELCRKAKEKGIHTVLDTCGFASWNVMEKVLKHVDLVLFDVKHMAATKHKEGTGVDNELIMSNAGKTAALVRTWFRVPLIPGFNDSPEDIRKIAEFARSLHIEKVSLLPYHELGSSKYAKIGKTYSMDGLIPTDEEKLKTATAIFESHGLKVEKER
ncbi:MAG: glycyl-radical enzyme activating protein [Dehalococcoidia bacterium]|nr:glycyl-radical enzyme activating protein [Dehalococcoidia bacterium]MDD5493906.1 glycyl-radical enzyme activating protein [Dehalococcoidia bacterium]